jgi:hypothetical protein
MNDFLADFLVELMLIGLMGWGVVCYVLLFG